MEAISPEELEQARAEYTRALQILQADQRARDLQRKQDAVGRCFKHIDHARQDPSVTWPIYVAVIAVDQSTGALQGWNFQTLPSGQIAVTPELDLQPGFLLDHCHEVARSVFVAAFNDLLTDISRFANRIPQ